uniref:Vitamin B12-dependent ribonucleotide reductase n=1 Tax=Candidatus Methanogaster sp. ANME-2c ERB4 TaxID=2759911 RepID=A0A7G9YIQ8_9EURY|nr:vitamin B12-dependent ribonucleoside-diphosphate reductase [Methanosarcinales archaeon ANME-2c ERB4]
MHKIIKRDGRIVNFKKDKITAVIHHAIIAVNADDEKLSEKFADEVATLIEERIPGIPAVEDVQNIVEEVLVRHGLYEVAKAYILYRERRSELRDAKKFFGVYDELKLTVNAIEVLKKRYLMKNEAGNITETPDQMFKRVAKAVSGKSDESEEEFYTAMRNLEFLPNSPTLMNAGTKLGQLSACFAIPIFDSIESIFGALKAMAIVQQSGGGSGFSFSRLRPRGDIVRSTMGGASGPVSFMRIFDVTTDVIKQGGRRRGANMGILNVNHPDILNFITSKSKEGVLTNFNISVGVDNDFMEAVKENRDYELINPRNNECVRSLSANDIFDLIGMMAWRTGDPGLVFIDEINAHNPTPEHRINSTNPCGEVPLLDWESCNLGSINLARIVRKNDIDWEKLRSLTEIGVRFLDGVIDVNRYPLPQIAEMTRANRKIGLGVMGFAEMLLELEIPYNSEEALNLGRRLMKFITVEAGATSIELGEERGTFPNIDESVWKNTNMRNATLTTIAPTGSISIIAGTTSGIEPLFAVSFVRNVLEHARLIEVNPVFERVARERGFYSRDLMMRIAKTGSVQGLEIPEDVRDVFVTALDIDPVWHVRMQAAFQEYVDNAISKTINLRKDATPGDVKKAFLLAYELKCKGITVYRYGSRAEQVLSFGESEYVSAKSDYAGGCPDRSCPY